ncbi:MAG: hypothetical protein O2818_03255 [Bacteroidetes bacterium]|nr:hypothetical protein [Bacteroidota bacterium]MDA1335885.1 hypothetical protein [Bacteroidota bacterium]
MKRYNLALLLICSIVGNIAAQKAYVLPSPTDANSEITLFIDMNQSEDGIQNNGLSAILDAFPDTTVYLWTWNPSGPAAGNGDWDNSAEHQLMTKVGPKLYSMTFVPTEYYGVDGPQLFSRGISCLAKLKNGYPVEGFNFEAKSEDIHIDIIPQLCAARICIFPELREPDDFLTITYDNTKEVLYEGLQGMGDDDCYLYLLGKVDAFTSYEYAPASEVFQFPELKMESIGEGKFRTTIIPEDFFAGILGEGEALSEIWYYIVREGFDYPPGPPPFEIISLLDCE